jgi:hypothetical protein
MLEADTTCHYDREHQLNSAIGAALLASEGMRHELIGDPVWGTSGIVGEIRAELAAVQGAVADIHDKAQGRTSRMIWQLGVPLLVAVVAAVIGSLITAAALGAL